MKPERPLSFQGRQRSPQRSEYTDMPLLLQHRMLVGAVRGVWGNGGGGVWWGGFMPGWCITSNSVQSVCFGAHALLLSYSSLSLARRHFWFPQCRQRLDYHQCYCQCRYYKAAKLADALQREHHYTVDEKQKSVLLTEEGYEDAEDVLEVWVASRVQSTRWLGFSKQKYHLEALACSQRVVQ